jgi:hypothetical protein
MIHRPIPEEIVPLDGNAKRMENASIFRELFSNEFFNSAIIEKQRFEIKVGEFPIYAAAYESRGKSRPEPQI